MGKCKRCGVLIEDGVEFCSKCSEELQKESENENYLDNLLNSLGEEDDLSNQEMEISEKDLEDFDANFVLNEDDSKELDNDLMEIGNEDFDEDNDDLLGEDSVIEDTPIEELFEDNLVGEQKEAVKEDSVTALSESIEDKEESIDDFLSDIGIIGDNVELNQESEAGDRISEKESGVEYGVIEDNPLFEMDTTTSEDDNVNIPDDISFSDSDNVSLASEETNDVDDNNTNVDNQESIEDDVNNKIKENSENDTTNEAGGDDSMDDIFAMLGMVDDDEKETLESALDAVDQEDRKNAAEPEKPNKMYEDVLATVGSLDDNYEDELEGLVDKTAESERDAKKKRMSKILFGEEEEEVVEAPKKKDNSEKKKKTLEKKQLKQEKKAAKKKAKLEKEQSEIDPEDLKKLNKKALVAVFGVLGIITVGSFVGTNVFHYSLRINKAEDYFSRDKYTMAYEQLNGINVKKGDKSLFNKVQTIMYVQQHYDAYNSYVAVEKYDNALDQLLRGVDKYDKFYEDAVSLGIDEDINKCEESIANALHEDYNISIDEAKDINNLDNVEYSQTIIDLSQNYKGERKK